MKNEPLNEGELGWLENMIEKYSNDHSIMDVAELDGMLTAVLSAPYDIDPATWLLALWGGANHVPRWVNDRERDRFIDLTLQHMNDIAERLSTYPEQFEPLFGIREAEGQELTIVEEWCFGYMRGASLADWSGLPAAQQAAFDAIALHGAEENFDRLDTLSEEEFTASIEALAPAALALYDYWAANPKTAPVLQPVRNEAKIGRNDPCPCGSGKKYKQCCQGK